MKSENLTMALVNLAGIMERADVSLLPGVYKEVGAALHTDPIGLDSLTLFRSIVQSSCYPLAAYLFVHHNRAHVIALESNTEPVPVPRKAETQSHRIPLVALFPEPLKDTRDPRLPTM
ncbi:hypothetical protein CISIN_1g039825mg [Citrus sinensis]|uniref:Uncharacterized protein n=1 Tax=Citrus sinensis TaxID=2711 RepID=A0A067D881_CITSI|nr:hypothetical protein CISIN_1g039825mg [Citrus sinensis]